MFIDTWNRIYENSSTQDNPQIYIPFLAIATAGNAIAAPELGERSVLQLAQGHSLLSLLFLIYLLMMVK